MATPVQLIIGLGNPGARYELTRHNAGAWFLAALAAKYAGVMRLETKLRGHLCSVIINDNPCKLFVPTTYMNLSGQAVRAVVDFYKISAESVLVAHDELDFVPGIVRFKVGGGANGHNGLQDIITQLGTKDFCRLRIGIGKPKSKDLIVDYVTSTPSIEDKRLISLSINRAIEIVPDVVIGSLQQAIQLLHSDSIK